MKKKLFIAPALALALIASSCQKNAPQPQIQDQSHGTASKGKGNAKIPDWNTFKCVPGYGGCQEVIIHVPRKFDEMTAALQEGKFPDVLSHDQDLYNMLAYDDYTKEYIDGVINGTHQVLLKTDMTEQNSDRAALLFADGPVSNESYDFAMLVSR